MRNEELELEISAMEKELERKRMVHEQKIAAIDRETMAKIKQVREKSYQKFV